jgi:hypothetical protein
MINYNGTIKDLAAWIEGLKEAARRDDAVSISWFNGTKDYPFAIIGGWADGFAEYFADILCVSKADPKYAMCIKIAINEGPYAYTDYEIMNMPYNKETGDVDDTEQALEWEDNSEELATWFLCEWERIMKEHGEKV